MSPDIEKLENAERLTRAARKVSEHFEADVIFYSGPIVEPEDRLMIQRCSESKCLPNAYIVLVTYGGSPHAAYRMGRCLQRNYDKVIACVPGPCVSAGTLMALAANELVMFEYGFLGPLDIQLRKTDELFEMQSGLTASEALTTLRSEAQSMFEQILLDLKAGSGGQITLKTALETAATLTAGVFSPLFAQIDPMRLGEDGRSTRIIEEYGGRLQEKSGNFTPEALKMLVAGYPSHTFEIDIDEAREGLFENVREPFDIESGLIAAMGGGAHTPAASPLVSYYCDFETGESNGGTYDTANTKRKRKKDGEPAQSPSTGSGSRNGSAQSADKASGRAPLDSIV